MLPYLCTLTNSSIRRRADALRHRGGIHDAQVGLVRNHDVDVVGLVTLGRKHISTGAGHAEHRALENFLALENPRGRAIEPAGVAVAATHALDDECVARVAVAAELLAEQALDLVRGLEHDGGTAVTEQHDTPRLCQSMNAEINSPPTTTAFLTTPVRINALAVLSAYRKLVHAVFTS